MARRWSSVRRVADMRCGMRATPAPHMRVTRRCAAAEGAAGVGDFSAPTTRATGVCTPAVTPAAPSVAPAQQPTAGTTGRHPHCSPHLFRTCSALAPHLLRTCSVLAPHLLRTCSALAPHLLRTCSALAPHLLRTCSALDPHLFRACATLVPHVCRTCSALVPHLCRNVGESTARRPLALPRKWHANIDQIAVLHPPPCARWPGTLAS